jgi:NAD-dependent dihydropyrimidine dehydrogenase PreA subunit
VSALATGKRPAAAAKAKRAAAHPERPGDACRAAPGTFRPEVDHGRCEGKQDCVDVCPYDVFEVRRIEPEDYDPLSLLGRLKVRVHGMKTAYPVREGNCRGCGLCVVACPEKAITLTRLETAR